LEPGSSEARRELSEARALQRLRAGALIGLPGLVMEEDAGDPVRLC
jgi:hypothetical protein